jgi:hypothetical protein
VAIWRGDLFDHKLLSSLKKIRDVKSQFNGLRPCGSTQAALVSQIELCDTLLDEIRSVSYCLERRLGGCRVTSRRSMGSKRNRSSRYQRSRRVMR